MVVPETALVTGDAGLQEGRGTEKAVVEHAVLRGSTTPARGLALPEQSGSGLHVTHSSFSRD